MSTISSTIHKVPSAFSACTTRWNFHGMGWR
jgi:hypothetical protein